MELAGEAETGSVARSVDRAGRHLVSTLIRKTTTMALTYLGFENLDFLTGGEVLLNVKSRGIASLVRRAAQAYVVAVVVLRDSAGSTIRQDEG